MLSLDEIFSFPVLFFFEILWFIAPAYLANGMPTVFGGGTPIDFGKNWRDGKRIFGDGKTWLGALAGFAFAMLFGVFGWITGPHIEIDGVSFEDKIIFARCAVLAIGTLSGDAIGSFIKRRRDITRGSSFLGLDQLGFIVISLILIVLTFPFTMDPRYTWFDFVIYTAVLIPVTFIIHIVFNWGSYKAGLQDVKL